MAEAWKVGRPGRSCAACGRAFAAGEPIVSAARAPEGTLERRDFCPSCWSNDDAAEHISFWRTRVPDPPQKEPQASPQEVTDFFLHLAGRAQRDAKAGQLLYLSALWLIRKRRLKLVERRGGPVPVLVLERMWDGERMEVPELAIPPAEFDALVEELGRVLGMPHPAA